MENCAVCHRRPKNPLNLRCEHHPCFSCISDSRWLKRVTSKSQCQRQHQQQKFEVICPFRNCSIRTASYDINNLVMNSDQIANENLDSNQQECYFVRLNKASSQRDSCGESGQNQAPLLQRRALQNYQSQHCSMSNSLESSRVSINQSHSQSKPIIPCKKHPQRMVKYFCYDCSHSKRAKCQSCPEPLTPLLCEECLKAHIHSHNILTLSQSISLISEHNEQYRAAHSINKAKAELKDLSQSLTSRKQTIVDFYSNFEKSVDHQYKEVLNTLHSQYGSLKASLKEKFSQAVKSFNHGVELLKLSKSALENSQELVRCSKFERQVRLYIKHEELVSSFSALINHVNKPFELPYFKVQQWSANLIDTMQKTMSFTTRIQQLNCALFPSHSTTIEPMSKSKDRGHRKSESQTLRYESLISSSNKRLRKKSCVNEQRSNKENMMGAATVRLDLRKKLLL